MLPHLGEGATGIGQGEARAAAEHPAGHSTVPAAKDSLAPNANSAEVGNDAISRPV